MFRRRASAACARGGLEIAKRVYVNYINIVKTYDLFEQLLKA
jgi:hypothetical protein